MSNVNFRLILLWFVNLDTHKKQYSYSKVTKRWQILQKYVTNIETLLLRRSFASSCYKKNWCLCWEQAAKLLLLPTAMFWANDCFRQHRLHNRMVSLCMCTDSKSPTWFLVLFKLHKQKEGFLENLQKNVLLNIFLNSKKIFFQDPSSNNFVYIWK